MEKVFISHKKVKPIPMTLGEYNIYQGWTLPENQNQEDKGYLVEYLDGSIPNHPAHDGYISWSPEKQFDRSYIDISNGFDFGEATREAKAGVKISRKGWNGKGMYAAIMPGFPKGVPANEETAKLHNVEVGSIIKIAPYWVLKTAQNDVTTWAPSGSDSLAEDWQIYLPPIASTPKSRLLLEHDELEARLLKLKKFLILGIPDFMDNENWDLLLLQNEQMDSLLETLETRVNLME
jgi:hypothetical protein